MTDAYSNFPPENTSAPATPTAVPHSREAEEAVVGAVFINPEVYYDVAQFLSADDFYIHRHKWIWDAFTSLHEQRIPIDLLTVSDELERRGQLGENPKRAEHEMIIKVAALAFWDAFLKDDAAARDWLDNGGFATWLPEGMFESRP